MSAAGIASLISAGSQVLNSLSSLGTFDYQKRMQQKAWDREDTAIQRRVADLKAAGLSPVLAAGSGASSSAPINVKAPQSEIDPLSLVLMGQNIKGRMIENERTAVDISRIHAEREVKQQEFLNLLAEQQEIVARTIKDQEIADGQRIDNSIKLYDYGIARNRKQYYHEGGISGAVIGGATSLRDMLFDLGRQGSLAAQQLFNKLYKRR